VSQPKDERVSEPTPLNLYSLSHLEVLLGRSRAELRDLARHAVRYYEPFQLRRRDRPFARKCGPPKKRLIDNPIGPLKTIQSRIEGRLLKRLVLPEHLLGGVRGKSIADNARLHANAKHLVTMDIKNFFPSITPRQVRHVWRTILNCSPSVSYLLTGLTTYRDRLPQGAPTSTLLANLVLSGFDHEIRAVCDLNRVSYSSWVDDLAFSGDSAASVVGPVIGVLIRSGFSVSHQKIEVMGPSERKILNNLVLGRFVTVQGKYVSRIRAGIHNLNCGKVKGHEVEDYVQRLEGSINYLRLFDVKRAARFTEELRAALGRIAKILSSSHMTPFFSKFLT
jgi:RNA-directed DNA polymerase